MKKTLLTLSLVLFALSGTLQAQNQLANNGFESWEGQNKPKEWNSLEFGIQGAISLPFGEILRVNDSYSGDFAAQLTPKKLDASVISLIKMAIAFGGLDIPFDVDMLEKYFFPAILTNATPDISLDKLASLEDIIVSGLDVIAGDTLDLSQLATSDLMKNLMGLLTDGLDVSSESLEVSSIDGYYKFQPVNETDNAVILAILLSNAQGERTIAGGGAFPVTQTENEYTKFSIPIRYLTDADELVFIAMASTFDSLSSTAGSLKIDDITINYAEKGSSKDDPQDSTQALNTVTGEFNVSVYPNPSVNKSVRISTQYPQTVKIYNTSGILVKEIPSYIPDSEIKLDNSGIYFIKTDNKTLKVTVE